MARFVAPGAWLHLDVRGTTRAEALAAALLDAGAPAAAATEALQALHLGLSLCVGAARVFGVPATTVALDDGAPPPPSAGGNDGADASSRRGRRSTKKVRAAQAPAWESAPAREGQASGRAAKAAALDLSGRGGVVVGVIGAPAPEAAAALEGPAPLGALVAPDWLLASLTSSSLPPITRALAHKALTRATAALAEAYGQDTGDTGLPVLLDERHARHLVGGVVVVAALLEAIGPGRITASALCLPGAFVDEGVRVDGEPVREAAPSSWAAALTAGLPGLVADDDGGRADIAGLALLAALPHRHGPRGFAVHMGQGQGSCAVDRGPPALVRAQWGPPPPVPTHAARSRRDTAWQIHATLAAGSDMSALDEALRARGATAVLSPTLSPAHFGVAVVVNEADLDSACRALWQAGAGDVACAPVERRSPEVRQMTVLVGRGKTKAPVAVSAWLDGGEVLRVDADPPSLRAAARSLGAPLDAVFAFAVAEFERLRRAQNPRAFHRIDDLEALDSKDDTTDRNDPQE